jgi:PDZ domain-containing protein
VDDRCVREGVLREELEVNDEILRVDGEAVGTSQEIGAALADREPGDVIELTYRRDDAEPVTIEIELIESPIDDGRAIIGIMPFETASVELPFEMAIDTGEIGGPSAGLAFVLTLIDELTEGDLLGGHDVAVTGTIELDGSVGAIGGLPQKASAVRQAGIDYFLVPAGQSEESLQAAREVAGDDVELIEVATVDDALAALEELGGDPVPD